MNRQRAFWYGNNVAQAGRLQALAQYKWIPLDKSEHAENSCQVYWKGIPGAAHHDMGACLSKP
jgi:hypothetical protein